jgi:peptidoglycan/xylan/chitin deacetylase (PgdA/CDA1 family)
MKVSLTFDNGPHPEVTPHVLDTLERYAARATFFVLGKNLQDGAARALAERAWRSGHRIGNHSYNHAMPFGLLERPAEGVAEVLATDALLGEMRGSEPLFRPFGRAQIGPHLMNRATWQALAERRFTCVLWHYVAREREMPDSWMEPALQACRERPWSVIVMHDLPTGAMRNLARFLDLLRAAGAELTQDFPEDCTPLRCGQPIGRSDHLMPA